VVWRADTLWTCVLLYIFLFIYDGNVSTTPSVSFCVCEARLRVQPLVMFFGGVQRKLFPATTAPPHNVFSLRAPYPGPTIHFCSTLPRTWKALLSQGH
jgi:hypothetical protein